MLDLSSGQQLLYGGVGLIAAAAVAAIVCIVLFAVSGKKIKKAIEHDYGKLEY